MFTIKTNTETLVIASKEIELEGNGEDCVQCDTKKRELLKCVVAAMYCWQHCKTGTLSYRQPRHFSNQGADLKRQVIMVQFRSIKFFWISSIFFFSFSKVPVFLCHPV